MPHDGQAGGGWLLPAAWNLGGGGAGGDSNHETGEMIQFQENECSRRSKNRVWGARWKKKQPASS